MELLLFYARQLFQFWVFLDFHMFFCFLFYFFFSYKEWWVLSLPLHLSPAVALDRACEDPELKYRKS